MTELTLDTFNDLREKNGTIYGVYKAHQMIGTPDDVIPFLINDLCSELVNSPRALELTDSEDILSYFKGFVEGWKDIQAIHSEHNI